MNLKISNKRLAKLARLEVLNMIFESNSAHIGSCFSCIDIITVIYNKILNLKKIKSKKNDRDLFILSKGHACASLYAVLALKKFFNKEKLKTFGKNFSPLMSHVSHKVPGVEFSTGSLGHGLPFAVGCALARKISGIESKIIVLMSDGELNEGSNWEAMMFASHHALSNLTFIIDKNNLQSLTTTNKTLNMLSLEKKFKAFGLNCKKINGHNYEQIQNVFKKKSNSKKPTVIIANTIKGKGVREMHNKVLWHYKPPSKEQFIKFKKEIL